MTQRVAFATAAGLTAFVVVLLGALGAYVALGGATSPAPSVAAAQSAPGADIPAAPQAPPVGDPAPTTGNSISPQEAARIALSQVPGAALAQEPRLVETNGVVAYEVLLDQAVVYIDAGSGQVLYSSAAPGARRRGRR